MMQRRINGCGRHLQRAELINYFLFFLFFYFFYFFSFLYHSLKVFRVISLLINQSINPFDPFSLMNDD